MTADERIIALVKPEYLEKIPKVFRGHATGATCALIAREHPDLYDAFNNEPSPSQIEEMTALVNGVFEERMNKHHML